MKSFIIILLGALVPLLAFSQSNIHKKPLPELSGNLSKDTVIINKHILDIYNSAPGSWDTSGMHLNDLYAICSEQQNWYGTFQLNRILNNYYYMRADYANALKVMQENYNLAALHNNNILRGVALLGLAENNMKALNNTQAFKYLNEAYKVFKQEGDSSYIALSLLKYSFFKMDMQHADSAYYFASEASPILKKNRLYDKYVSSLKIMAITKLMKDEKDEALKIINLAIEEVAAFNVNFDLAELYLDKTLIYTEMEQFDKATAYGKLALEIAVRDSILREMLLATEFLYNAYNKNGDFENAFKYLLLNKEYFLRFYDENKMRDINQLNALYETGKKEAENNYLKNTAEMMGRQIRIQWVFLVLSTIGTSLVLILLYLNLKARRTLKRNNETLHEKNKLIESINQELSLQLSKVELQQVEIQKKNEELNNNLEMQNKLIYVISHDLLSPFNALLGLTEILSVTFKKNDEDRNLDMILHVNRAALRAYNLSKNMLSWIQSYSGAKKIVPEVVHLEELVLEVKTSLQLIFETKNQKFINKIQPEASVVCDKNMLETVVRNLMQNASKFTPEGGRIKVSTSKNGDYWQLIIKDSGIGIQEEDLKKIFTINNHDILAENKGTGFGLIISKEFIDKNNGKIWAESTLDKGTSFFIELPAVQ